MIPMGQSPSHPETNVGTVDIAVKKIIRRDKKENIFSARRAEVWLEDGFVRYLYIDRTPSD